MVRFPRPKCDGSGAVQFPCVLPGASVFPAASELTVYTHNSVPIWIPIGGGGNEFRWSGSDKRRPSVRQGGLVGFKLSRRFPAAANFVRPSNRLLSLQCLSCMLEMGSGKCARCCVRPKFVADSAHFSSVSSSSSSEEDLLQYLWNSYGGVGIGKEGGDIAERKEGWQAPNALQFAICFD